ncbi:hypothetical protein INP77_13075 [Methylophilus sp. 13]|uniref:hypothetical protein n=1 Tax=Methylophilus sp. 13 TaxID=2781018 RepID=UPI00188F3D34|nr:hypothetical protein [Methylophilus sp. 13]MBF5040426.1 hypothetical protein [Methylophilus sp. 13]
MKCVSQMRQAFVLLLTAGLSACSSIPANTAVLLDKTSERIETRSEVISQTLRTVLDESTFAKGDVEDVLKLLKNIDISTLSDDNKKAMSKAIGTLTQLETSLGKNASYSKVPEESKRIFSESVTNLKLVKQIIATEVNKKALVQNMIDIVDKDLAKGESK